MTLHLISSRIFFAGNKISNTGHSSFEVIRNRIEFKLRTDKNEFFKAKDCNLHRIILKKCLGFLVLMNDFIDKLFIVSCSPIFQCSLSLKPLKVAIVLIVGLTLQFIKFKAYNSKVSIVKCLD